jgi:putative membrane protein
MMKIAEHFLSEAEKRMVEARIAEAEKRTSGEIVVMVAPSSYHYPYAGLLGSTLLSVLGGIAVSLVLGRENMWFFLSAFVLLFIVLNELSRRFLQLRRPFISSRDMREEVEEAAIRAFYRSGINRTAGHTGILIYLSLFEHKVRVIADKAINDRVGQAEWQELVDIIIGGFHDREPGKALAKAVDRCGDILAAHFPLEEGDVNELPDTILIGGDRH